MVSLDSRKNWNISSEGHILLFRMSVNSITKEEADIEKITTSVGHILETCRRKVTFSFH